MSLAVLPHELCVLLFVELSGILREPFAVDDQVVDTAMPEPLDFSVCSLLARTNKRFNDAWRVFHMRYMMAHMCAVVRGCQIRHIVNSLLFAPGAAPVPMRGASCAGELDQMCELATRVGRLCELPDVPEVRAVFTDRRCIRESLRFASREAVFMHNMSWRVSGEIGFYAAAHLFAGAKCLKYSITIMAQQFAPLINFAARTAPDAALDNRYVLQMGLFLQTPQLLFRSTSSTFPELDLPRSTALPDCAIALNRQLAFVRSALTHPSLLCLPSILFSAELRAHSAVACAQSTSTAPLLYEAIDRVRGTEQRARATVAYMHYLALLHYFCGSRRNLVSEPVVRVARPGLGCHGPTAAVRSFVSGLMLGARGFRMKYGIKVSDEGVVSAADTVLQTIGDRAYEDSDVPWWRGVTTPRAIDRARRHVLRMQNTLLGDPLWAIAATDMQRLAELYDAETRRYTISGDTVFSREHRGMAALWQHLNECCAAAGASKMSITLENTGDPTIPPLKLFQFERGVSLQMSLDEQFKDERYVFVTEVMLNGRRHRWLEQRPPPDMPKPQQEFWIGSPSLVRKKSRVQGRILSRAVEEWKNLCWLAANCLRPGEDEPTEFVFFWNPSAHYNDVQVHEMQHMCAVCTAHPCVHTRAADAVPDMRAARPFFRPFSQRIASFIDGLGEIESDAELQRTVSSMCVVRLACVRCSCTITARADIVRGTCARCATKKRSGSSADLSKSVAKEARATAE